MYLSRLIFTEANALQSLTNLVSFCTTKTTKKNDDEKASKIGQNSLIEKA